MGGNCSEERSVLQEMGKRLHIPQDGAEVAIHKSSECKITLDVLLVLVYA